jgi:hypothetical protein
MAVHEQHLGHIDRHDELVSKAERQHRGGADLVNEIRPEPDSLARR